MTRWAARYGTVGHSRQAVSYTHLDVYKRQGVQCLAAGLHTSGSGADSQRFFPEADAIMHQRLQICFRHPCSAMPKPPTEAFRGALEQHWNSSEPRCLDPVSYTHLDVYKRQPLARATRTCRSRFAPRSDQRICCFLTIRLATRLLTLASAAVEAMRFPSRYLAP